jgi:hypothetical protein
MRDRSCVHLTRRQRRARKVTFCGSLALPNSGRLSMTLFHRIAGCILMASLLGLAGCPVGMDRGYRRGDGQSSEQGRHDDGRGDRGDSRRDDGHDRDQHQDEHPR